MPPPVGRIDLRKRSEEPCAVVFRDPNTCVDNFKQKAPCVALVAHAYPHAPGVRELDRVSSEVKQDLANSSRVRRYTTRHAGAYTDDDLALLALAYSPHEF